MSPETVRRQGTVEEIGEVQLEAGKPVDLVVEYTNTRPPEGPESDRSQPALMRGLVCDVRLPPWLQAHCHVSDWADARRSTRTKR